MRCLRLNGRQESSQLSKSFALFTCDLILVLKPALSISSPSVIHWISKIFIDSINILFLLYFLLWFGSSTSKPAGFHQDYLGTNQGYLSGSRSNP